MLVGFAKCAPTAFLLFVLLAHTLANQVLIRKRATRSTFQIFLKLNRLHFCWEGAIPNEVIVAAFHCSRSCALLLMFFHASINVSRPAFIERSVLAMFEDIDEEHTSPL